MSLMKLKTSQASQKAAVSYVLLRLNRRLQTELSTAPQTHQAGEIGIDYGALPVLQRFQSQ